jgi:tRNA(Ile2) C34 agmatinyltransferase TiaS
VKPSAIRQIIDDAIGSFGALPQAYRMRIEQLARELAHDLHRCVRCGEPLQGVRCEDCRIELMQIAHPVEEMP